MMLTTSARVLNRIMREILRLPVVSELTRRERERRASAHQRLLPPARPEAARLVATLRDEGVVTTSLRELALTTPVDVSALLAAPPASLFRLGLDALLLDLAERHVSAPVRYHGFQVRTEEVDGKVQGVRQWHLDPEDFRMLKMIVYLTDVDAGSGPFEHLTLAATDAACTALRYVSGFVKDEALARLVPESRWVARTGPAGTVILADTSRVLHRARAPLVAPRRTLTLSYTSRRPLKSYDAPPLPHPAALVGLSARQAACLRPEWLKITRS